jgi:hypothetical protein
MDRIDEKHTEDGDAEPDMKAVEPPRTGDEGTSAEERRRDAYRLR